ncbi:MAG: hypothetical protein QUV20_16780 [Oceanibaculum nanhaiense]|uniref:hypothetical protein n=1 Tax=Oceanibaculum nanhaiense TaxID=1909734 RepID=UPI0025A4A25F|nr:hypothetical protein [Oceanibaculum nanhaiense]MDM7947982.1 hypothetical protein [Oceanibaculum nanhaiense]
MSDNYSHRVSNIPPPGQCRFVEDENLSGDAERPSPCFYSRISDEDLSAASMAAPTCSFASFACQVDFDEDLSAAGMIRPTPNCSCYVSDSDEELLAVSDQSH